MGQIEALLEQALQLPAEQRAELAHELLVSLGEAPPAADDGSLAELIADRQARLRSADAVTRPWQESIAQIRDSLKPRDPE